LPDFAIKNLEIFLGMIPPDHRKSAPGAWTQTPISVWLAGVPIVPVLRNDHFCRYVRTQRCVYFS